MIISNELFSKELGQLSIKEKKWVIGLSGGADSLCLTLLSDIYAKNNGIDLYACIVDHKLRDESSTEIIPIIEILKKQNIKYKVFVWNHAEEIIGNIEQKARIARYGLLYQYCKELNAKVLMTAHHAKDQWETFFMRLSKGSSLKGLASIKKTSTFRDIHLIRPFLNFSPKDIKETLKESFGITEYVKDPSNKQLKFERVRWRESYDNLSKHYGLNIENVNQSIERLQSANECLKDISEKLSDELFDGIYINISKFKELHIELKIRVLDKLINDISEKGTHIVSHSLLIKTANLICKNDFTATNLSGLIFKRDRTKNVKIYKENRFEKILS